MELSESQKKFIDENCEKITDLTELTRATFDKDSLDGRTKEGRAVREYLVNEGVSYETKHVYPKEDIQLTEEQKEFSLRSSSDGMDSVQIASIIFSDKSQLRRSVKTLEQEPYNFLTWIIDKEVDGIPMFSEIINPENILFSQEYKLYDIQGILINHVKSNDNESSNSLGGGGNMTTRHLRNFINAIRENEKLNSPIDDAVISQSLVHYANLAYRSDQSFMIDQNSGNGVVPYLPLNELNKNKQSGDN